MPCLPNPVLLIQYAYYTEETLELRRRQCLSKAIGGHKISGDILHEYLSFFYSLANLILFSINMLRSAIKFRVLAERYSPLIIGPDDGRDL